MKYVHQGRAYAYLTIDDEMRDDSQYLKVIFYSECVNYNIDKH